MTDSADDAVIVGREAWARIKENSRRSWDDWLKVGRALQIGRTAALAAAGCNAPVGSKYNVAMGRWLVDHQLDGVVAQERYAIQKILEHLDAVTAWRDGLPEPQRRRHNHPSLWHVFRRATKAETGTSTRQCVRGARSSHKHGKPVHWPQDMLRRAAMALRECSSNDIFKVARVTLEAAIRSQDDIAVLLETKPPTRPAEAPAAAVAAHA